MWLGRGPGRSREKERSVVVVVLAVCLLLLSKQCHKFAFLFRSLASYRQLRISRSLPSLSLELVRSFERPSLLGKETKSIDCIRRQYQYTNILVEIQNCIELRQFEKIFFWTGSSLCFTFCLRNSREIFPRLSKNLCMFIFLNSTVNPLLSKCLYFLPTKWDVRERREDRPRYATNCEISCTLAKYAFSSILTGHEHT